MERLAAEAPRTVTFRWLVSGVLAARGTATATAVAEELARVRHHALAGPLRA